MRRIERTTQFKRDFKRESKGRHAAILGDEFGTVVSALASDEPLAPRFRDHALSGDWKDHRDYHIRPDLLLLYRLTDAATLQLVRLGSYAELGL